MIDDNIVNNDQLTSEQNKPKKDWIDSIKSTIFVIVCLPYLILKKLMICCYLGCCNCTFNLCGKYFDSIRQYFIERLILILKKKND